MMNMNGKGVEGRGTESKNGWRKRNWEWGTGHGEREMKNGK